MSFHDGGMTYQALPEQGIPIYLQETLEEPALQTASPTLALILYFPNPSPALSLPVLPSMPPSPEPEQWFSFYVAYC